MKLKDAMEKATKGPLEVDHNNQHAGQVAVCHGEEPGYYELWSRKWAHRHCHSQSTDAALLAHWYNIGPKLLEALEKVMRIEILWSPPSCLTCPTSRDGRVCDRTDECAALNEMCVVCKEAIAEANEVKGID